ncbi:nuclear transport factor 2 family protein [Paraburkholderia flagellata]|uniref:nuclear transport factor 2 family protein n=1 Tax=Paraburkholderia flagellata TaxID=2883241 RepID=UPI001F279551|nr:nuclear transport factor 2 family protein [Paraburkholderia flagellata]
MQHPVFELEQRRCAALLTRDFVELDLLTSPRLVYVHAPGVIHGREALMQFIRQEVQFSAVQRRDLQVRAAGDVAWMTGLLRYEGWRLPAQQAFEAFSFVVQIWVRVDRHWQMELCQSTKVEEASWRAAAAHAVGGSPPEQLEPGEGAGVMCSFSE